MKKIYVKPAMTVHLITAKATLLCGSSNDSPQWWDQPGGDKQF